MTSAGVVIHDMRQMLTGESVFLTGSLVSENAYGLVNAHSDVDLFCPSIEQLMATGQRLLDAGYKLDEKFDRVWWRWKNYGLGKWHTNSLKLLAVDGTETNLIYKTLGKAPVRSLTQVIESFDFGLLAMGYDLGLPWAEQHLDLRAAFWPTLDPDGPLPMMRDKRTNWRRGFFSQYNGLRESGRYAKYHVYGYDMSLVKDDLIVGYQEQASYLSTHFDPDKVLLGKIYEAIADHIEFDNIDELTEAYKKLEFKDSLDSIMEALE